MDMMVRVKIGEAFKDGNILGGKFFAPNSVHVISEKDAQKIRNSGGTVEVLEQLIPNPLKIEKLERAQEEHSEKKTEQENLASTYNKEVHPASEPATPESGKILRKPVGAKKGNRRG